jgi:hypothetical protein
VVRPSDKVISVGNTLNVKDYMAFGAAPSTQVINGTLNWVGPTTNIAGAQGAQGALGNTGVSVNPTNPAFTVSLTNALAIEYSDFGTRIYEYIFDQNDFITHNLIEEEIREGVKKYIPNLEITNISIMSAEDDTDQNRSVSQDEDQRLFRVSEESTKPYTAVVKIEYSVNNGSFSTSDFIILNI